MNAKQQQAAALFQRILDTDPETTRYAGAALGLGMIPTIGSIADNQYEGILNEAAAAAILAGGMYGGGYLGRQSSMMSPDEQESYIRSEVNKIKNKAAEMGDPIKGADYYGHAKQKVMDDFEPFMRGAPETHPFSSPKRQIRGTMRGAMLGTLAAALPSYLAMRGGEIEK